MKGGTGKPWSGSIGLLKCLTGHHLPTITENMWTVSTYCRRCFHIFEIKEKWEGVRVEE